MRSYNEIAIARAETSIADIGIALSRSSCNRLHALVTGYCQALLDCGVISEFEWKSLTNRANEAQANWREPPDPFSETSTSGVNSGIRQK